MTRTDPNRNWRFALVDKIADDLTQALACCDLNALHTQNDRLAVQIIFGDIRHVGAQML